MLVGLIAFVFVLGSAARGSTRWINVGVFTFQPSEFGKLLFVLAIAGFLAERAGTGGEVGTTFRALGLGAIPPASCSSQPDLGTALVYLAASARCCSSAARLEAPVGPRPRRGADCRRRVLGRPGGRRRLPEDVPEAASDLFTHPATCPLDARYNVEQSIAAVGSGEVRGRGVDNATQTRLDFLPEHHTDFVFASFSEQRGFIGA